MLRDPRRLLGRRAEAAGNHATCVMAYHADRREARSLQLRGDRGGYWAYLTHPAHVRSEMTGIPHLEKFAAIDVSDSDDPELGEKIAALQARNFQEHPEMAALVAQAPSFTVPDGKGSAA